MVHNNQSILGSSDGVLKSSSAVFKLNNLSGVQYAYTHRQTHTDTHKHTQTHTHTHTNTHSQHCTDNMYMCTGTNMGGRREEVKGRRSRRLKGKVGKVKNTFLYLEKGRTQGGKDKDGK